MFHKPGLRQLIFHLISERDNQNKLIYKCSIIQQYQAKSNQISQPHHTY